MPMMVMVAPTGHGVGLTSVCLGLVRALERRGVAVGFCKPIAQPRWGEGDIDRSTLLIRSTTALEPPEPLSHAEFEDLLAHGREQVLLEEVVARCQRAGSNADVVIIEGLVPTRTEAAADRINGMMARSLDASIVLVGSPEMLEPSELAERMSIIAHNFGDASVSGCVVNRIPAEASDASLAEIDFSEPVDINIPALMRADYTAAFHQAGLKLAGLVPSSPRMSAPRMSDLAEAIGAEPLTDADLDARRIMDVRICAMTVGNAIRALRPGVLVITPGDRADVMIAAAMASLNGTRLAGVLLTGNVEPNPRVLALCSRAIETGLPILSVKTDTFSAARTVHEMDRQVRLDDQERAELVMNTIASSLDQDWLLQLVTHRRARRLSPPAFRHQLIERARKANCRIVLPEGDEPRTINAAAICAKRRIARPVLLGDPDTIANRARDLGVELDAGIDIIDPADIFSQYVDPMVELRKHKGLTAETAADQLQDTVVLGTMMLKQGDVDGLVSGAVHTTAHTIRPALQLIRTAPDVKLVSSIFFMCLPDQVLIYGDCAVNIEPDDQELADIAVQSAASAKAFGIEPRVAMISYSTGESGSGTEVEKVRRATAIAQERMPDIAVDGPLQYDAAANADVAKTKAPDSPVAGRATVFIFPDLNTGNTTYKAVQRSANVVSMGPMLQGLALPVNDLSRGALVEDIVYTIALTAIQAGLANREPIPGAASH